MPWIPLATSGLTYQFLVYDQGAGQDIPGFPANVTFSDADSVIALAPVEPTDSDASWTLNFPGLASVRVRITALNFVASVQPEYYPAYFGYWVNPVRPPTIDNLADSSGDFVNEFLPAQVEVETFVVTSNSTPAYVYYGSTSHGSGYVGSDRNWQFLLEVFVDGPEPPTPPPAEIECDEVGQVTRNNVSGHTRSRVFQGSLYASETRCLVTNFNGAIGSGRTIASAVWESDDISTARMFSPAVGERDVKVMIAAQYSGYARIRVSVTLDNGEVYSAWHRLRVMPAPYFNTPTWTDGQRRLEASAL